MGNIVFVFLITFIILGNLSGSAPSYAQNLNDSYGPLGSEINTTAPNSNTQDFNWLWLLPLLAVPLVFLFLPIRRNDKQQYVGVKGGRSSKRKLTREDVMGKRSYLKKQP